MIKYLNVIQIYIQDAAFPLLWHLKPHVKCKLYFNGVTLVSLLILYKTLLIYVTNFHIFVFVFSFLLFIFLG